MGGIQRLAGNLGEKSGTKMRLGSRGLEGKLWQERAPCWEPGKTGLMCPRGGRELLLFPALRTLEQDGQSAQWG